MVQYEGNVIVVSGRRTLFKYNITKVEANYEHIFVMLHIPRDAEVPANEACNVLSLDHSGSIEWRIKSDPTIDLQEFSNHPYYGLTLDSDNELFVTNSSGVRFEVDQETGELRKKDKLIEHKGNELVIAGRRIFFKYDVYQIERNDKHIFVLLDVPSGVKLRREEVCNVFSFEYSGKREWQIKNVVPNLFQRDVGVPFVGLNLTDGNTLFATDFSGIKFQVNQQTGELGQHYFVK